MLEEEAAECSSGLARGLLLCASSAERPVLLLLLLSLLLSLLPLASLSFTSASKRAVCACSTAAAAAAAAAASAAAPAEAPSAALEVVGSTLALLLRMAALRAQQCFWPCQKSTAPTSSMAKATPTTPPALTVGSAGAGAATAGGTTSMLGALLTESAKLPLPYMACTSARDMPVALAMAEKSAGARLASRAEGLREVTALKPAAAALCAPAVLPEASGM
jgi:hypothetical protein